MLSTLVGQSPHSDLHRRINPLVKASRGFGSLLPTNEVLSPHSDKTPADKSTGEMSSRGLVGPRLACRVLLYFLGLALFSRSEQLLSSLPRGHSSTVDKSSPSSINLECLRSDPAQLGSLPSGAGEAVNRPQLAALPKIWLMAESQRLTENGRPTKGDKLPPGNSFSYVSIQSPVLSCLMRRLAGAYDLFHKS